MKHLVSFLFGLFFLFSMAGNTFAMPGNVAQNSGFQTVSGKNLHNSHHHKTHKVSSIDLSEDDDTQSLQNSWMAAIAVISVLLPAIFKIFFAEKSIDFSRFSVIFKPNLRTHLLLRKLSI